MPLIIRSNLSHFRLCVVLFRSTARPTSAYCRAVDSWCSVPCCGVDWRTYTIAKRSTCQDLILGEGVGLVMADLPGASRRVQSGEQFAEQFAQLPPPVGR